jgi:hypothetical protein
LPGAIRLETKPASETPPRRGEGAAASSTATAVRSTAPKLADQTLLDKLPRAAATKTTGPDAAGKSGAPVGGVSGRTPLGTQAPGVAPAAGGAQGPRGQ